MTHAIADSGAGLCPDYITTRFGRTRGRHDQYIETIESVATASSTADALMALRDACGTLAARFFAMWHAIPQDMYIPHWRRTTRGGRLSAYADRSEDDIPMAKMSHCSGGGWRVVKTTV